MHFVILYICFMVHAYAVVFNNIQVEFYFKNKWKVKYCTNIKNTNLVGMVHT